MRIHKFIGAPALYFCDNHVFIVSELTFKHEVEFGLCDAINFGKVHEFYVWHYSFMNILGILFCIARINISNRPKTLWLLIKRVDGHKFVITIGLEAVTKEWYTPCRNFGELLLISKIYFLLILHGYFLSCCVWLNMNSQTSLMLKYPARFVIHLNSFVLIIYGKAPYSAVKVVLCWKVTFRVRRILVTLHRIHFKILIIQLNRIFKYTCSANMKLGIISLTYIESTNVFGHLFIFI